MRTVVYRFVPAAVVLLALISGLLFAGDRDVTFIHISDQHYNSEKKNVYPRSRRTVRAMNRIAGTPYPDGIDGRVDKPRGVVLSGDMTDRGKPEEWKIFQKYWGLTGKEGMLKLPMYGGAGNHDVGLAAEDGYVRKQIIRRNPKRPGNVTTSENGLHYSWDWDDVHFVNLNEYAGLEDTDPYPEVSNGLRKIQRYGNPAEKSLQFLRKDLKLNVGSSDRPVVIVQHYGFDDFAFRPWGEEAAWWTEEQALRLWEAIEEYNVIGILGGHNGSEDRFTWHGIPTQHLDDMVRFGVYRISDRNMTLAMYNSKSERWEREWTSSASINSARPPQLVQGPYLVQDGDPGTMTICWRTNANVSCTLKWGEVHFRYEQDSVEVGPYDRSNHLYKYTISGLKRGTGINFALKIQDRYAPGLFHTTEQDQEQVYFLLADTPPRMKARDRAFQRMYRFIYRAPAYHSFILHPDGPVEQPSRMAAWDENLFLRKKAGNHVRYMLRRAPLVAPTGETKAERTLFPYDYNETGGYTFKRGPVSVAVLNTQAGLSASGNGRGRVQERWLRKELEKTSTPWQCVVWEKTDSPQKNEQFKKQLQRICDEYGVELCVAGGDRYERERIGSTTYMTTGNRDGTGMPGMLDAVAIDGNTMSVHTVTPEGKTEKRFEWEAN